MGAPTPIAGLEVGTRYRVVNYAKDTIYVEGKATPPDSTQDAQKLAPWPHLLSSMTVTLEAGEQLFIWAGGAGPDYGRVSVEEAA